MTAIRLLESSGSNGSIQIALDGDFSSSDGLVFVTGSERLGIGTSTPSAKLHVSGGTIFGGSASDLHQFTGSVVIGASGTTSEFWVNGINLTPISGSAIVPGGTTFNYDILSLSGVMSDNQYTSFNVDVIGTTRGITNIANISAAKRLVSISMVKAGGQFTVVGITETDAQNYNGPSSVDNANSWDINVDVSGSLYVNTNSTPTDTAWGVIVTKKSVIDVNSGILVG